MNQFKTMVLMVLLTIMLVAIGSVLGGKTGMTVALLIAFGMNFITYWFSDKIVLRMYGARQIIQLEKKAAPLLQPCWCRWPFPVPGNTGPMKGGPGSQAIRVIWPMHCDDYIAWTCYYCNTVRFGSPGHGICLGQEFVGKGSINI